MHCLIWIFTLLNWQYSYSRSLVKLKCLSGSIWGFPGGRVVKNPPASAGDTRDVGSIPVLERSPGGENSNPLQYSCLEVSMDRGAWWTQEFVGSQRIRHDWTHTRVTFLIVTVWWWVVATGIWCVETRDATQHSTIHRTAPHNKGLSSPNCQWCWRFEIHEIIEWWETLI